eukprot:363789-Chlamydomonas_euryale.AAC.11
MQIEKLGAWQCYSLTTDGFKKKYIDGGAPLINVIALLPDRLHPDISKELEPNDISRIMALVTDSASANSNGMKILEEEFPHLILIPCQAHALNLLIKDVAGQGSTIKCKWTAQVFKDVLHLALV